MHVVVLASPFQDGLGMRVMSLYMSLGSIGKKFVLDKFYDNYVSLIKATEHLSCVDDLAWPAY